LFAPILLETWRGWFALLAAAVAGLK